VSNEVYANGMELACKAGSGKSICAFPDVCFTPPENPATPPGVPTPYPNTGMASDTTDGSTTVQISGKEVMLKNKSYFKSSSGDEAGCAAKKGVLTSVNRGKVYFTAWSMNVKFEGENVVRNLDLTTHNHASPGPNTGPWSFQDAQAWSDSSKCAGDRKKKKNACVGEKDPCCPGLLNKSVEQQKDKLGRTKTESRTVRAGKAATKEAEHGEKKDCVKASRCQLKPYEPKKGEPGCCPGQTPHHIPPFTCFENVTGKYSRSSALCVCLEGASQHVGSHGKNHAAIDYLASIKKPKLKAGDPCTIKAYNKMCAKAVAAQCGCNAECIAAQLDESLKPTDRQINHWHSSSKQLGDLKSKLKPPRRPK
jgi:hypothetical protein